MRRCILWCRKVFYTFLTTENRTLELSPKAIFLTVAIFCLWLSFTLANTNDWSVVKSTHFIVYYKNAPGDFIEQLIEKSEYYYDKIADDLGLRRFDFWLWDNRAKIYIHDDAKAYQTATNQPGWSVGCAIIKEKVIHTFPYAKGFFQTTLPHEMGHIIFREFVGFDNQAVPIWLDEGVASYQENLIYSMAHKLVIEAIATNKFVNLENLSKINPQLIKDNESALLFYAEAVSMIDYMVKEFGKDNFILFCQNLRDKADLERAISYAYPFRNIQELDQAWQKYILNK